MLKIKIPGRFTYIYRKNSKPKFELKYLLINFFIDYDKIKNE